MEKQLLKKEVLYIEYCILNREGKDREVSDRLREEFLKDLDNYKNFWVNLSKVPAIGSPMIGVIAFMADKLQGVGNLVLYGASQRIKKMFEYTVVDCLTNIRFEKYID